MSYHEYSSRDLHELYGQVENEYMDYLYEMQCNSESDLDYMFEMEKDRAVLEFEKLYHRMGMSHLLQNVIAIKSETCGWINLVDRDQDYYEIQGDFEIYED